MVDATPWEPPAAGTEVDHLRGALLRLRATFRWKADDLSSAGLDERVGPSRLTLGGLLKHLAVVEDSTFTTKLTGQPMGEPWASIGWDGSDDEREFTTAADDPPEDLYRLFDGAVARSEERLEAALRTGGVET